jgi:26S proteasome non-ATPase regulatory subunit 9
MKIMKQKDEIEQSIADITEYLEAPGMPGVTGRLVDEEGFPRADLDLFEIRKMRNRLACLQTDHVNVMKQIE